MHSLVATTALLTTKRLLFRHPRAVAAATNMSLLLRSSNSSRRRFLSSSSIGNNVAAAKDALRRADCVCFDVDSTVLAEEGIDILADSLGVGKDVAALTAAAMGGAQTFDQALQERLNLMRPSRQDIADCLTNHPPVLSPGIQELVQALHNRNTHVHLVSGGFRLMIAPVAKTLQIAQEHVYANTILFDDDGNYAGFDDTEFTSRDEGKSVALRQLQNDFNFAHIVMVGDGMTDAQAKPPAVAFIGYGGVTVRPAVQTVADWYVTDLYELTKVVLEG